MRKRSAVETGQGKTSTYGYREEVGSGKRRIMGRAGRTQEGAKVKHGARKK
ncbi:hypothetical protein K0M31_007832 [Melipona bicolor]|uniref:Uncharacterized protein n=1 Tax=Melipona bicolor TaxID=60889 RepID=A0AA40KW45_9HYME|nr:hypothetical protein K0M31_007832 [Melipona bicolor]